MHIKPTKDVSMDKRDEVREFLRKRVSEMQIEGIIHRVENVVSDGKLGALKPMLLEQISLKNLFLV